MVQAVSSGGIRTSISPRIWRMTAPPPGGYQPEVPTYLFQSIAVTLLCCLPVGLVAIYYAAQVNSKLAAGDIPGAQNFSGSARTWCWIAFLAGLFFYAAWVLFAIVWGIAVFPVATA